MLSRGGRPSSPYWRKCIRNSVRLQQQFEENGKRVREGIGAFSAVEVGGIRGLCCCKPFSEKIQHCTQQGGLVFP
jgi:hypothetical protein